jgi:hypothetical protein
LYDSRNEKSDLTLSTITKTIVTVFSNSRILPTNSMRKILSLASFLVACTLTMMAAPRPTNRQLIEFYVLQHKDLAVFEHVIFGIPASVTLAQALLESNNGLSYLARAGNNHFGMKCPRTGECGSVIFLEDDEYDRKTGKKVKSAFRTFRSVPDSYREHSLLLRSPRYARLFNYARTDYVRWARGLQECGYATNPQYANILLRLIQQYNLDQYDLPEVLDPFASSTETETENFDLTTPPQISSDEQNSSAETIVEEHPDFEIEPRTDKQKKQAAIETPAKNPTPAPADKVTYTLYEFTDESAVKTIESKSEGKTPAKQQRP